ncbi:MAG: energy-coupling factor ABC transporter substrate-binding protein [Magnetococcales bacterium]|nr:energy-coupling factor ABC transporter substrate-binding protein [Magnetococcales bacterium]
MKRTNVMLLFVVVMMTLLPLVLPSLKGSEFAGADGQAQAMITTIDSNYQPWFEPLWEPPGGETETLLFALQAALGAGFLGYYIGLKRGAAQQDKGRKHHETD